jgi:hypothetical protein
MTWKQFKDAVEQRGVKDDDEMEYIDWGSEQAPVVDYDKVLECWAVS